MAAFNLRAVIDFDGAKATAGMNRAKGQMRGLAAQARASGAKIRSSLSNAMKGAAGGLVAGLGFTALAAGMRDAIAMGSKISDVAMGIGITNERLQELEYSAIIGGGSMENVQKAFVKIGQAATQASAGNKTYMDAFKGFGITAEEIKNSSPDELFQRVGKAMQESPKDLEYMNNMMYLFGKQGTALLPMFALNLDEMSKQAHEVGFVLKNDVVDELDAMEDKLQIISRRVKSGFGKLVIKGAEAWDWLEGHVGEGGLGSYIGYRIGGMSEEEAMHQTYNVDRSKIKNEEIAKAEAAKQKKEAEKQAAEAKKHAAEQQAIQAEVATIEGRIGAMKMQQQTLYEGSLSESEKQALLIKKIKQAKEDLKQAETAFAYAGASGVVGKKTAEENLIKAQLHLAQLQQLGKGKAGGGKDDGSEPMMRMGMSRGHTLHNFHDHRKQQIKLLTKIWETLAANNRWAEADAVALKLNSM